MSGSTFIAKSKLAGKNRLSADIRREYPVI